MAAKQAVSLTDVIEKMDELRAQQAAILTALGSLSIAVSNQNKDMTAMTQLMSDNKKPARAAAKKTAADGATAGAGAAAAPAVVVIPKTKEAYFIDKYVKDTTYAAKFASVATSVREMKEYASAKDKSKKEAALVYANIKKAIPYEAEVNAITKEFDALRAANTEKRGLQTPVGTSPSTAAVAEAKANADAAPAAAAPAPAPAATTSKKRATKKDAAAAPPATVPVELLTSTISKAVIDDSVSTLDDDE